MLIVVNKYRTMKRSLENATLPELPQEIWILFGKSFGEDYQSLSKYTQTCSSFANDSTLSKILTEWKLGITCVLCRTRKGQIHSNCTLGGRCLSGEGECERQLDALCLTCAKGRCDWCGYGNCGCHEMEESCNECDSLFCEYCQNDYNALRLDDWPIVCRICL